MAALIALSGCALQPQPSRPLPPPSPPPSSPVPVVVLQPVPVPTPTPDALSRFNAPVWAYQERLRSLDGAALVAERARAEVAHAQDPTDQAARLQLVLALVHDRGNGQLTLARALGLLEPLLQDPADPQEAPWQPLARLLRDRLSEQRRLEEQTERQAQQLRDQQRRIEQLGNQIEALRAIERSLTTRPIPNAAPAGESAPR